MRQTWVRAVPRRRTADELKLERVIRVLAEAGEDAETKRWVQGIYDQAMALRRIAKGSA